MASELRSDQKRPGFRQCPTCRIKIVVPDNLGLVIKNAIIRVNCQTGLASAKCPRCKSWVEVPLKYSE